VAEGQRTIDYAPDAITGIKTVIFGKGPQMQKKKGVYYFSHGNLNNNKYRVFYARGNPPYGPFT